MNEKYDVIIIGAGIGGLTCGCYLAKSGLKVLIIEQHDKTGGCCTSFQRKGYRFDAAVHYLGSIKRGILGKIFEELEIKDKIKINQFDPTDKIVMPDNSTYIRANPYDTLAEFQKSFPKEKAKIESFFKLLLETKIFALVPQIKKFTFQELLDNYFDDFRLKATISGLLGNLGSTPSRVSALAASIFFREFILDPGYYPVGGMQTLPNTLSEVIKNRNGKILLSSKVKKILTENRKVKGVILENGAEFYADFIVSNADATLTYKTLLGDNSVKEFSVIDKLNTSCSCAALYIGLKTNPKDLLNESTNIWFFDSYDMENILGDLRNNILREELPSGMIYFPSSHDPSMTTDRHTIQILVDAPYESEEFWTNQKNNVVEKMFNLVKKVIPSLKDEDVDLKVGASPLSFKRYTSNTKGAIFGWESSLEQINPGLIPQESSYSGLFLAGHWCTSGLGGEGGISGVSILGRNAARLILNKLNSKWPWELFILK